MTDIAKVREMSDKELEDALKQAKQDLWSARFALSTRQLNDTSSIPHTRRTIARILTVQRERGTGRGTAAGATGATAAAGNGKGA
jgi:large subunit ribosomal protein L29